MLVCCLRTANTVHIASYHGLAGSMRIDSPTYVDVAGGMRRNVLSMALSTRPPLLLPSTWATRSCRACCPSCPASRLTTAAPWNLALASPWRMCQRNQPHLIAGSPTPASGTRSARCPRDRTCTRRPCVLSMPSLALSLGLWRLLDTAKVLVPSCVELGIDSVLVSDLWVVLHVCSRPWVMGWRISNLQPPCLSHPAIRNTKILVSSLPRCAVRPC